MSVELSEPLKANLEGDRKGVPGWYTHFGSLSFAESAVPVFGQQVENNYSKDTPLTVIGLGSGAAMYDMTVTRMLKDKGYDARLIATDLQKSSLMAAQPFELPMVRVKSNFTQLPLTDGTNRKIDDDNPQSNNNVLLISRAVEHYLGEGEFNRLVSEAGRVLRPGELYIAQISSGDPLALEALAAGIETIGGKKEKFLSLKEYKEKFKKVKYKDENGKDTDQSLFNEIKTGAAETQTGRDSVAQARRYLNQYFLTSNVGYSTDIIGHYMDEVQEIEYERNKLGQKIHNEQTRIKAIKELDTLIKSTDIYTVFRQKYVDSVATFLKGKGIEPKPGMNLNGITIVGEDNHIDDISLAVEYPIVVWQKNKKTQS